MIERAAFSATPDDIARKLRNAPAWVRNASAVRGVSAPPAERPTWHHNAESVTTAPSQTARRQPAPVIGWLAGVCCPGVSRPALGHRDGERLPEQFTRRAWEMILQQVRSCSIDVPLTLGHDGPVLCSTRGIDLTFDIDRTLGLEFTARLRDTPECRKVLADISAVGWGVSVGYRKVDQWIVERDGIGRVRVIDGAELHHVAVIDTRERRAAYAGARCYAARGTTSACPSELRTNAHVWAFREVRKQAGCRP